MSNLSRWEPTSDFMTLRDAMDRLFDDAFTRPFSLTRNGGSTWPAFPIDMYQTNDDVVVQAVVPGFRPGEVYIQVTGNLLTIRGQLKQEEDKKERAWHLREHRFGSFGLPVVPDRANAEFENGILTITLPKAEEVKPKAITIKAK